MTPQLGSSKAIALAVFNGAVYETAIEEVEAIKTSYAPNQERYLSNFGKDVLYRTYSQLEDITATSQGSENKMAAVIKNNIRSVEPQKVFLNIFDTQRRSFLRKKAASMSCTKPVPPYVEHKLCELINVAKKDYLSTVEWVPVINQMKATVRR